MTVRLFEQDAYRREFQAMVTACREHGSGYAVCLDATAFYPEGGGQPGDTGTLTVISGPCEPLPSRTDTFSPEDPVIVTDTHEKGGEILHYTSVPLEPGTAVTGMIDWEHRFDLMQNHSGEHIVSGLIHSRFGYNNVGFHMGSDFITIDLDGELTEEDLYEIEKEANQVVYRNETVIIRKYPEEEASSLSYRSKKELHDLVRIVTFPGADVCACCGTHVARTGEIGLIKLLSVAKFRSGVRIEMLSGSRAFSYLTEIWQQNHRISVLLSAKPLLTSSFVEKLKEHDASVSYELYAYKEKLFEDTARQYYNASCAFILEPGLTADEVRRFTIALMKHCSGLCAVFSGDDENGYKYAVGQNDADLRALVKSMNAALNGRGGGKPFFSQGNVSAGQEDILAFLKDIEKGI